jgi:HNH endonuclease
MNLADEWNPVDKPVYKRYKPKRADRGKFSEKVRIQIKDHFNRTCQGCGIQREHLHIHHVMPKGSGVGRGVFTNGLLVCNPCHRKIHDEKDQTLLKFWQDVFRKKYGVNYFRDTQDLKEMARVLADREEME